MLPETLLRGDVTCSVKGYVKATIEFFDGKLITYKEWEGKEEKLYTDFQMQEGIGTTCNPKSDGKKNS